LNNNFTLYVHISPNGKRYVGITSKTVNQRWCNGQGYVGQPFYNAIKKYGWNNIEHKILATGLSKEDAEIAEIKCIKKWKTTDRLYGYNTTRGGNTGGAILMKTDKARKEMSDLIRNKLKTDPVYAENWKNAVDKKKIQIRCVETGDVFQSIANAAAKFEVQRKSIGETLRGSADKVHGYSFEYVDDPDRNERAKTRREERKKNRNEVTNETTEHHRRKYGCPILCLNNSAVYTCVGEAATALNLKKESVGDVVRGKADTIKGYRFEYVNEEKRKKAQHERVVRKVLSEWSKKDAIDKLRGIKRKPMSEETRRKMSENSAHRKWRDDEKKHLQNLSKTKKRVYCVELDTIFPSANAAAKELGLYQSNISFCCTGRLKTTGKMHFRFVD